MFLMTFKMLATKASLALTLPVTVKNFFKGEINKSILVFHNLKYFIVLVNLLYYMTICCKCILSTLEFTVFCIFCLH